MVKHFFKKSYLREGRTKRPFRINKMKNDRKEETKDD